MMLQLLEIVFDLLCFWRWRRGGPLTQTILLHTVLETDKNIQKKWIIKKSFILKISSMYLLTDVLYLSIIKIIFLKSCQFENFSKLLKINFLSITSMKKTYIKSDNDIFFTKCIISLDVPIKTPLKIGKSHIKL